MLFVCLTITYPSLNRTVTLWRRSDVHIDFIYITFYRTPIKFFDCDVIPQLITDVG